MSDNANGTGSPKWAIYYVRAFERLKWLAEWSIFISVALISFLTFAMFAGSVATGTFLETFVMMLEIDSELNVAMATRNIAYGIPILLTGLAVLYIHFRAYRTAKGGAYQ